MQARELSQYFKPESDTKSNQSIGTTDLPKPNTQPISPQYAFENALGRVFPQKSEETNIIRIRKALGETAKTLSDPQIECIVTEFQFLIDSWLDEYEKEVFKGMSLKEVLNNK